MHGSRPNAMGFHPITSCAWRVGEPSLDEVRIVERAQRDGSILYAVTWRGWVANRDGELEYEPIPSSRDPYFTARCRFDDWEDAALMAQRIYREHALPRDEEGRA